MLSKFQDLVVLLPCQSLEDLALDRSSEEADQLLSAWCAPFHPVLLHTTEKTPRWERAEDPPRELGASLIIVPPCCEGLLPEGWLEGAIEGGAHLVRGLGQLDDVARAALEPIAVQAEVERDLVEDFHALAFCLFQVELVTRQLRYMSSLDEAQFQTEAVSAAQAALKGDGDVAREYLRAAFSLLAEAREYFYPIEASLVDLTLVARGGAAGAVGQGLTAKAPVNLLLSGEALQHLAREEPDTLAAVRFALEKDENRVSVVGGEFRECELPLMPPEGVLSQLRQGLRTYEKHLGRRPSVFGRRRFGLGPLLPQVLEKLGFVGAIHCTLDDGRFPSGNQSKIRWQGMDATALDALARVPLDAGKPSTFLRLPEQLGEALDLDHSATIVFAHWAGRSDRWYEILQRMEAFSPVLGTFRGAPQYFEETEQAGQVSRHAADQYRSPYLRQDVGGGRPDPISRWVRYHRRSMLCDSIRALATMAELVCPEPSKPSAWNALMEGLDSVESIPEEAADTDDCLEDRLGEAADRFAAMLRNKETTGSAGYLLVCPWSFPQQVHVDVSSLTKLPAVGGAIRAATEAGGRKEALVEVPAMGFVWVAPGQPGIRRKRS